MTLRSGSLMIFVALTVAVAHSSAARADDLTFSPEVQSLFRREIARHDEVFARWYQCPADIDSKYGAFWGKALEPLDYDLKSCAADPEGCLAACFEARSGDVCFSIGLGLQDDAQPEYARLWESMYAFACALGHAGGCTNRAAGILQGGDANDPFAHQESAARVCTFRTFGQSCAAQDAWGCAMLGQAYQDGEGVAVSLPKAKAAYRMSCELNADFAACSMAKRRMEEMAPAQ